MASTAAQPAQETKKRSKTVKSETLPKIVVPDTNVLMHDPTSLVRFEENDIYITSTVLEELDNNKKGPTDVARNSREVSRFIEALIQYMEKKYPRWKLEDGLPLEHAKGGKKGLGRLFVQTEDEAIAATTRLSELERAVPDNHIIAAARILKEKRSDKYAEVVLVTKDINVRIKARSRGLKAEDYTNDLVAADSDEGIYTGMAELPAAVWDEMLQLKPPDAEGDTALYQIDHPRGTPLYINQLVTTVGDAMHPSIVVDVDGGKVTVRHCVDYERKIVSGISARNLEQSFLLNLLMDNDVHLVSILGDAGAGKTLLTIAAALAMKNEGLYSGIIMTRVTVPVGEDIGFLPGTEEDKMGAWMGALDDNLEVIAEALATETDPTKRLKKKLETAHSSDEVTSSAQAAKLRKEIQIKAMNFWRGRTFLRKVVIIDEAQNLTPKQMKTLITRAGPGTKIVCLGNLGQIDTPYLTETSSGLSYLIDRFRGGKGWIHFGHVTLPKVERSPLAEYAVEVL
jgi:PhoH-like ATPase